MCINKVIRLSWWWLALIVASLIHLTSAKADEGITADKRLTLFIEKYEQLKNKDLPLDHPDNPFHPYLGKRFEDGLDERDKTQFLAAQLNGNCFLVNRLVYKGFLHLYPFLEPAFTEYKNRSDLKHMLKWGYRAPSSHCLNHEYLKELKQRINPADYLPMDMRSEIDYKYQRAQYGKVNTDRDQLISNLLGFGKNAFCNDYPLGIGDVIKMANQPGGMRLTAGEQLYLAERAHLHGYYDEAQYKRAIKKLRQKFKSASRFDQIRQISRDKQLHQIDLIKGFWPYACKEVYKMKLKGL